MTYRKKRLTRVQAKLLEMANDGARRPVVLAMLDDPPWGSGRPSSWTTFVPEAIYEIWDDLTLDAKLVAYMHAAEVRDGANRFDTL